jgi:hypothetical protein
MRRERRAILCARVANPALLAGRSSSTLERMSRDCPHCGVRIGRIRTDYSPTFNAKWYRFSSPRYYCPKCGTELCTTTQPLGYALLVAMALAVFGFSLALWRDAHLRASAAPHFGLLIVLFALAWFYARWGIKYSTMSPDVGHAL